MQRCRAIGHVPADRAITGLSRGRDHAVYASVSPNSAGTGRDRVVLGPAQSRRSPQPVLDSDDFAETAGSGAGDDRWLVRD